jgi:hypothetical protein
MMSLRAEVGSLLTPSLEKNLELISDALFVDVDTRAAWVFMLTGSSAVINGRLTLQLPQHLERASALVCAEVKSPEARVSKKSRHIQVASNERNVRKKIDKTHASRTPARQTLSPSAESERGEAKYLMAATKLGCALAVTSDAVALTGRQIMHPAIDGMLSPQVTNALREITPFLLPSNKEAFPRLEFRRYVATTSVLVSRQIGADVTDLRLLKDLGFYDEAVLSEVLKKYLDLSSVAALGRAKSMIRAAGLSSMGSHDAVSWMMDTLATKNLGVKVYGAAMLPKSITAKSALDAPCSMGDISAEELTQVFAGYERSACTWQASRLRHGERWLTMLDFYFQSPHPKQKPSAKDLTNRASGGSKSFVAAIELIHGEGGWRRRDGAGEGTLRQSKSSEIDRVMSVMNVVKTAMKDGQKRRTAALIADVAKAIFSDEDARRDWYVVLAIESKFMDGLTSPTGAYGYGQLIPSYYADFGKGCDFEDTKREDITDSYANLLLSACYLKTIRTRQPFISQALVAYNAGPNSRDLKIFSNLGTIGLEPANYVSRYQLIREMLDVFEKTSRQTPI